MTWAHQTRRQGQGRVQHREGVEAKVGGKSPIVEVVQALVGPEAVLKVQRAQRKRKGSPQGETEEGKVEAVEKSEKAKEAGLALVSEVVGVAVEVVDALELVDVVVDSRIDWRVWKARAAERCEKAKEAGLALVSQAVEALVDIRFGQEVGKAKALERGGAQAVLEQRVERFVVAAAMVLEGAAAVEAR